MGVIYRSEFDSYSGIAWKIDIHDSQFSGSVTTFVTGAGGFQLSYKGITERNDPVLSSTVVVPFMVENSADEAFINAMMTAQEERYTVVIYRSTVRYWVGVMLPDEIQREYIGYPYEVALSFTDGLSRLKDLDYNNSGTAYSGRATLIEHIVNCLNRSGTLVHYETTDNYLQTRINWYNVYHTYNSARCPLLYTDLSHAVFIQHDNKKIEYKSCYYVLETILRAFNARIVQSGGVYVIYQVQDMINSTGYYRTFNKLGTIRSSGTSSLRTTVTDATIKTGAVYRYMQPFRRVEKTYKATTSNSADGNWLPVQSLYPTYVGLVNEVLKSLEGTIVTFTGTIYEYLPYSSAGINWATFPTFYSTFAFYIKMTETDTSDTYYLSGGNTLGTPPTWTTASGAWYNYVTQNTTVNTLTGPRYSDFVIPTPIINKNCTIEFKFEYIGSTMNGSPFDPTSLAMYWNYFLMNPFAEVNYNDEYEDEVEVLYYANNVITGGAAVASTALLSLPESTIGDGPNERYIGHLKVYKASTFEWLPSSSNSWRLKSAGTGQSLHALSVNQILLGQRIPVERLQATWINSNITAISHLVLGIKVYVPIMLTINPETDEVQGEWYNCIMP